MPVNQAIYPALSAAHSTGDPKEVSDRLATAFRLINLTVLPIGSALAAITPTALDIVYGATYVGEALTLSILSLSSMFVAQGVLLVTTLQAVGHTRRYLVVTLVSTIAFMGFVGFAALPLGTLSGAIGRALLSILIVALARFSLRHEVSTHIDSALSKAIPLAAGVGLPLLALISSSSCFTLLDQSFNWSSSSAYSRCCTAGLAGGSEYFITEISRCCTMRSREYCGHT